MLMGKLIFFRGCMVFMSVQYFQRFGSKVTFLFCLLSSFYMKTSLFHVQPPIAFKSHSTLPLIQKNMDIHYIPKNVLMVRVRSTARQTKILLTEILQTNKFMPSLRSRVGYPHLLHWSCSCMAGT